MINLFSFVSICVGATYRWWLGCLCDELSTRSFLLLGLAMAILAPILRSPRLLLPSVWVHANCLGSGASWVCSARRRSNQRRAPKNPGGRRRYGGYRPDEPPRKEYEDSGRDGVRFFAACHPFLQQVNAMWMLC